MQYPTSTNSGPDMHIAHRDLWVDAIKAGINKKDKVYTRGAYQVKLFYLGDHRYLFGGDNRMLLDQDTYLDLGIGTDEGKPVREPMFKISDNWAAKYVQIISPYLTQGELHRNVAPVKMPVLDPVCYGVDNPNVQSFKYQMFGDMYMQQQMQAAQQMQVALIMQQAEGDVRRARSGMLKEMLNYTPRELGTEKERRAAVEEALTFGFSGQLIELINMPGSSTKLIGTRYIMAEDIVWDPDATTEKDCKWLAIQCRTPAWLFSRLYGIPEQDINPTQASSTARSTYGRLVIEAGGEDNINHKSCADEVVYWKVWSRMGSGARLLPLNKRTSDFAMLDEAIGDFCFFIISESVKYPANFGPQTVEQVTAQLEQMAMGAIPMPAGVNPADISKMLLSQACAWPTPYYLDIDEPWPIVTLGFHRRNGSPYYIPHLEFSLSYLKFMVWAISFIADKTYRSMRDIWLIDSKVAEKLREAIENGEDEAIVDLADVDGKTLDQFVKMISAPELKITIVDVYKFFEGKVEQMTGLSDILQAKMARGMQSATEAKVISDAAQLRPNDMLNKVHAVDTRVARKEAIASIFHYTPEDVMPVLGQSGADAWGRLFTAKDPISIMRESQYTVVSSQGRVLDLATRQEQANNLMTIAAPMMQQIGAMSGDFTAFNAIAREYAEANQIDPELMQVPPMPMPAAPPKGVASPPKQQQRSSP